MSSALVPAGGRVEPEAELIEPPIVAGKRAAGRLKGKPPKET